MGCIPLRSETNTFPVDPSVDTIENCRRVVEEQADALVLIIGSRYGSVSEASGKSITNIEYLTARNKAIPIYVFVEEAMITSLQFYEQNQGADFSGIVDNVQVFEFVKEVRNIHRHWTFPFRTATDITDTLKAQFALQLRESFRLFRELRGGERMWLKTLSTESFRFALEQPVAWQGLLLAQVLTDAVRMHSTLRERHRAGITYGRSPVTDARSFFSFMQTKMNEFLHLLENCQRLVDVTYPEAIRAEDPEDSCRILIFIAQELAEIYRQALLWSQEMRSINNIEDVTELIYQLAGLSDTLIIPLETFGPSTLAQIRTAIDSQTPDDDLVIQLKLELGKPDVEGAFAALRRVQLQSNPNFG